MFVSFGKKYLKKFRSSINRFLVSGSQLASPGCSHVNGGALLLRFSWHRFRSCCPRLLHHSFRQLFLEQNHAFDVAAVHRVSCGDLRSLADGRGGLVLAHHLGLWVGAWFPPLDSLRYAELGFTLRSNGETGKTNTSVFAYGTGPVTLAPISTLTLPGIVISLST